MTGVDKLLESVAQKLDSGPEHLRNDKIVQCSPLKDIFRVVISL